MCLDTTNRLDPMQEGVGFKCFRNFKGDLVTALNHYSVKRGEWITNPYPDREINELYYSPSYPSGFHILERADEALLYIGHEFSLQDFPWRLSRGQYEIFPVRYRNAHTSGTQYGFKVIVANDIYILSDQEIEEFERTVKIGWGRPFPDLLRSCSSKS